MHVSVVCTCMSRGERFRVTVKIFAVFVSYSFLKDIFHVVPSELTLNKSVEDMLYGSQNQKLIKKHQETLWTRRDHR